MYQSYLMSGSLRDGHTPSDVILELIGKPYRSVRDQAGQNLPCECLGQRADAQQSMLVRRLAGPVGNLSEAKNGGVAGARGPDQHGRDMTLQKKYLPREFNRHLERLIVRSGTCREPFKSDTENKA